MPCISASARLGATNDGARKDEVCGARRGRSARRWCRRCGWPASSRSTSSCATPRSSTEARASGDRIALRALAAGVAALRGGAAPPARAAMRARPGPSDRRLGSRRHRRRSASRRSPSPAVPPTQPGARARCPFDDRHASCDYAAPRRGRRPPLGVPRRAGVSSAGTAAKWLPCRMRARRDSPPPVRNFATRRALPGGRAADLRTVYAKSKRRRPPRHRVRWPGGPPRQGRRRLETSYFGERGTSRRGRRCVGEIARRRPPPRPDRRAALPCMAMGFQA